MKLINSKKKRRRIKNVDESDVSGSESENEGRNKHGRKNIRKVPVTIYIKNIHINLNHNLE